MKMEIGPYTQRTFICSSVISAIGLLMLLDKFYAELFGWAFLMVSAVLFISFTAFLAWDVITPEVGSDRVDPGFETPRQQKQWNEDEKAGSIGLLCLIPLGINIAGLVNLAGHLNWNPTLEFFLPFIPALLTAVFKFRYINSMGIPWSEELWSQQRIVIPDKK